MSQYVFIHVDINGNMWKHIHFSYIGAVKARNAWASMRTLIKAVSHRITIMPRTVDKPCIIGANVISIIPLGDSDDD